jgi:uncharacterized membrane protein
MMFTLHVLINSLVKLLISIHRNTYFHITEILLETFILCVAICSTDTLSLD